MNERSGAGCGNETRAVQHRGQSEVIGMVLLLGAILIGAFLTIAIGGLALQSVQENAQGGLAEDTAQQAHTALSKAAVTGDPQAIPMGDGSVDGRIVDGGTLTITMHNGSDTCSRRVREDLGALRYEGGDRAMIYEGGAIWAETEAGLAIERAPPISYSDGTTRISVLSVAAATATGDGRLVAQPNESARRSVSRETAMLLIACPARGYTDLRLTVSSPYSEGWERHFERSVATAPNVTVSRVSNDTVQATIENATEPRDFDGLALPAVSADTAVPPGEHFTPEVIVANGNYSDATGTLELRIDGTGVTRRRSVRVDAFDVNRTSLNVSAAAINSSLSFGERYNYTIAVSNATGTVVDTRNGSFVVGTHSSMVRLAGVNTSMAASQDQLTIGARLRNYGLQNGTGSATLEFTDPVIAAPNRTATGVHVTGTGATTVGFRLDVTALPIGHYEYAIHGPNRTITSAFVIANRSERTPIAGDLCLRNVTTSGTILTAGDAFTVDTTVENVGADPAAGGVEFRAAGGANVSVPVTLDPGAKATDSFYLSPDQVATLETGVTHEYAIELASGNDTAVVNGSFYLGENGSALGVEHVDATQDDGTVTVTATLDNDGLANGTDDATLTMYEMDGTGEQVAFSETPTRTVSVRWGGTSTVTYQFDASSLGGNHTVFVDYGNETGSDTVALDALENGDGEVAISGAGNGTVRVLGTEVSAEWEYSGWNKWWTPIGVSVVENRSGTVTRRPFTNTETAMELPNDRNLNTYDTQFEQWVWSWEQDAGETMRLTLSSSLWRYHDSDACDYPMTNYDYHDRTGPGYDEVRTWRDFHPSEAFYENEDCLQQRQVDASTGSHPTNVRVLTDGAQLPEISRALPDQRTAAEVLNQGAEDRIDPDTGTLNLSSNEAVFLFELTDPDATWEEAHDTEHDPDYNDVIAIVEFDPPNGSVGVNMSVGANGTGLIIGAPSVSAPTNGTISMGPISNSSTSGPPTVTDPGTNGSMPGGPTPPDDVDVEVDVVTIG